MKAEQLPIQMSVGRDRTFGNFHTGDNAAAVDRLKRLCDAAGAEQVFVWGQAFTGKSHLLQAVCRRTAQRGRRGVFVPLKTLPGEDAGVLAGLENVEVICVDDMDAAAGDAAREEALFDLINRARARNCRMAFAARGNPTRLPFVLKDLSSRLVWGGVYRLAPLSDADKPQALKLHARERGCTVPDDVIRYLLHHHPRNMGYLADAVQRLDHASLRDQRRITVPFARAVLAGGA